MSVHSEIKKITTETLRKMKFDKEKITMLTAYDYNKKKMVDAGGVDAILVVDSASNVMAWISFAVSGPLVVFKTTALLVSVDLLSRFPVADPLTSPIFTEVKF